MVLHFCLAARVHSCVLHSSFSIYGYSGTWAGVVLCMNTPCCELQSSDFRFRIGGMHGHQQQASVSDSGSQRAKQQEIIKKKESSKLHAPLLLLARVASTEPHGNQLGHFEANPKLSAASF